MENIHEEAVTAKIVNWQTKLSSCFLWTVSLYVKGSGYRDIGTYHHQLLCYLLVYPKHSCWSSLTAAVVPPGPQCGVTGYMVWVTGVNGLLVVRSYLCVSVVYCVNGSYAMHTYAM